jgi:hypothetical protein
MENKDEKNIEKPLIDEFMNKIVPIVEQLINDGSSINQIKLNLIEIIQQVPAPADFWSEGNAEKEGEDEIIETQKLFVDKIIEHVLFVMDIKKNKKSTSKIFCVNQNRLIGYIQGNNILSKDGKEVGRVKGSTIYSSREGIIGNVKNSRVYSFSNQTINQQILYGGKCIGLVHGNEIKSIDGRIIGYGEGDILDDNKLGAALILLFTP